MPFPDEWVLNSQIWLNSHYSGVSGFTEVDEDGLTGWETVFGLTRALQHELGITALSDNFGPTTLSSLTSQVGYVSPSTSNHDVVALMQCGLWCKGYAGGYTFGTFSSEVVASLPNLNQAMGMAATSTLAPKAFKSLLTMDAYSILGSGTLQAQAVQRWLNGTYFGRADYFLMPCDGLYSRDVQRGLMLAIQYELGMADGTANGNFGPGTQGGLQTYGAFGLGATDSTRRLIRLFKAALIFNGYIVPFNGTFDSATSSQTSAFQSFVGLPVTGAANFQTWASLLVSTGDPNRSATGADASTPLTAGKAASLYSAGYRSIGRYLTVESKRYQPGELAVIFGGSLSTFPIYQEYNNTVGAFSYSSGRSQGVAAVRRARQLGFKAETVIHFAVDYDATGDEISAAILPFFEGVRDGVETSWVSYQIGVYGTRNVCSRVSGAGLAVSSFVSGMSTGYSGNLGFPLPVNWSFDQIKTLTVGSGASAILIDKDVKSASAPVVTSSGVWPTPVRVTSSGLKYDEFFWWLTELCLIAETAATSRYLDFDESDLYIFIYLHISRPVYNSLGFLAYLPADPIAGDPDVALAYSDFYTAAPAMPSTVVYGDVAHWAYTLGGHKQWGAAQNASTAQIGDLGGWALDLASLWAGYADARREGTFLTGVSDWINTKFADSSSALSMADLIADIDAYLVECLRSSNPSRPLSDAMREILHHASVSPTWRFEQFFQLRFGGDAGTFANAVADVFTNPNIWIYAPVAIFGGYRRPGEYKETGDPTGSELENELVDLVTAFVTKYSDIMEIGVTF